MANSKRWLEQCTNVIQGDGSFNSTSSFLFIPAFTEARSTIKPSSLGQNLSITRHTKIKKSQLLQFIIQKYFL